MRDICKVYWTEEWCECIDIQLKLASGHEAFLGHEGRTQMSLISGLLIPNEVFISPLVFCLFVLFSFSLASFSFPVEKVPYMVSKRASKTPNLSFLNPVIWEGTMLFLHFHRKVNQSRPGKNSPPSARGQGNGASSEWGGLDQGGRVWRESEGNSFSKS